MDNSEKLRVILQHWIEHNAGHVAEFEKWQKTMQEDGKENTAASIGDAVLQMDKVTDILAGILAECGGPMGSADHHQHHHHHDHD